MLEDLRGKAVLITGASIGIGAAAALAFGKLGANVAVHYNKNAEAAEAVCAAIRKLGSKAVAIGGDLSVPGTAKRVVEEAAKQLGRLDILLNNAGAIINVGSIAGADGGGPGSGHYACAKAYVHNLTRHMARDLASRKIRVNAISPGVIETAFHAATPPERMEAMKKSVPLGRTGTPEDCVGPILLLASTSMGGYVTGQILHVNGGQFMP